MADDERCPAKGRCGYIVKFFFSTYYCIRSFIGLSVHIKKQECYEDLSGCYAACAGFLIITVTPESGSKQRQSSRSSNAVLLIGNW